MELQCFEISLKAVVALIKSGELRRRRRESQSANDGKPWTVQCETFAGSAGSETATIDVEVSLPSLDDSAANEGRDAYLVMRARRFIFKTRVLSSQPTRPSLLNAYV